MAPGELTFNDRFFLIFAHLVAMQGKGYCSRAATKRPYPFWDTASRCLSLRERALVCEMILHMASARLASRPTIGGKLPPYGFRHMGLA